MRNVTHRSYSTLFLLTSALKVMLFDCLLFVDGLLINQQQSGASMSLSWSMLESGHSGKNMHSPKK